jgi:YfiH family protein
MVMGSNLLSRIKFHDLSKSYQIDTPYYTISFLGIGESERIKFFCPKQVHGTKILKVESIDDSIEEADASYTFSKKNPIAVRTADCLPLLLFTDSQANPVMTIHAGWKGFAKGIIPKALNKYKSLLIDQIEIKCAVGAAISQESFEIGPEVLEKLKDFGNEYNVDFSSFTQKGKEDRWHFDLQLAACSILTLLDIAPENISVIRDCTYLTPKWHSFRREKKLAGHNFTVIEKK